jgi:hypothetical protein
MMMSEERQRLLLALGGRLMEKAGEVGIELWKGDFSIDIDEIEIEFEGQTPRLTGRIEINLEASSGALFPDLLNM